MWGDQNSGGRVYFLESNCVLQVKKLKNMKSKNSVILPPGIDLKEITIHTKTYAQEFH